MIWAENPDELVNMILMQQDHSESIYHNKISGHPDLNRDVRILFCSDQAACLLSVIVLIDFWMIFLNLALLSGS